MLDFFRNNKNYLIKNIKRWRFERNFRIHTIGVVVYLIFASIGSVVYRHFANADDRLFLQISFFSIIALLVLIAIFSRWETVIKAGFIILFAGVYMYGIRSLLFTTFLFMGGIMAGVIQVMKEWERAVVLRLGKFKKIKGPGLFMLFPFLDTVTEVVDLRIRVSDFATETTLTNDSVTVTVDALCFWMVWDAEKAILEVENYVEAVVLSSQTALRNAISRNTINDFLSKGELIEEDIRKEVDKKTTEWGITIQHIEITDIQIPESLQVELSRQAIAEKERNARIMLGQAELELAGIYDKAGKIYRDNETAYKLRSLSVINEGLKEGNSMIITPSSISESLENITGAAALDEIRKLKKSVGNKGEQNVNS